MRFHFLTNSVVALAAALISSCGVGGGGIPNGSDPAQVSAATFWGSLGGSPGNTRLSNKIGPATNEVGWSTYREYGSSVVGIVTPDGTLVVKDGGSLIGFNPDGSVRWREPTIYSVGKMYMSNDGTICFQYNQRNFRQISQAGTLLLDYKIDAPGGELLNFGPDRTMYLLAHEKTTPRASLVAVNAQGETLYWQEADIASARRLMALPNGQAAFLSAAGDVTVVDANGNDLWSDNQDDLQLTMLVLGADNRIYGTNYAMGEDDLLGYVSYSLDGTSHGFVQPQIAEVRFRLIGVTPGGNTIWANSSDGVLVVADPDGQFIWQHDSGDWVSLSVLIGDLGEVNAVFRTTDSGVSQKEMIWFSPTGEIISSQTITNSEMVLNTLGVNDEIFTYDRDKLFAYDPQGGLAWDYDYGGVGSIAIGPNGTIYSTGGNILYANSPTGDELWQYSWSDNLGRLVVSGDDKVIVSSASDILEISSAGSLSNKVELVDYVVKEISLSNDGHVYTTDSNGLVKAFWPNLTPSWEFAAEEHINTRITVGEDGTLYFGDFNGLLYAVGIGGQSLWTFDTLDRYVNTPAVTSDAVYVTSGGGGLFKLGLDGSLIWRFEPLYYCYASPSIGSDGTVFIGTDPSRNPPSGSRPSAFRELPEAELSFSDPSKKDSSELVNDPVLLDPLGNGHGIYALDPEGNIKWNLHTNVGIDYPLCVDGANNVYLIINGNLFSISPYGRERWRYNTDLRSNTNLSIGSDGSIIFGARNFLFSIGSGR